MNGSFAACKMNAGTAMRSIDMRGGGAVVVIVGAGEPAIVSRDLVVKIAQASDATQA